MVMAEERDGAEKHDEHECTAESPPPVAPKRPRGDCPAHRGCATIPRVDAPAPRARLHADGGLVGEAATPSTGTSAYSASWRANGVTSSSPGDGVLASWIHVSDLHFGHSTAHHQWNQQRVLGALIGDARELVKTEVVRRPDFIFVTGDVAFSGGARTPAAGRSEYQLAADWIKKLQGTLAIPQERVFVVPGNHDVDRTTDPDVRRMLQLARTGQESLDAILQEPRDLQRLSGRMARYLSFAQGFGAVAGGHVDHSLWWRSVVDLNGGVSLQLCGLNTALLSAHGRDKGHLRVGQRQLAELLPPAGPSEVTVVLGHHPAAGGWLADEKDLDGALDEHAAVYLSGHVHEARSRQVQSGAGDGCLRVSAGAAHGEAAPAGAPPTSHGYNFGALVVLASGELAVRIWPRRWSSDRPRFEVDTANTRKNLNHAEHRLGERFRVQTLVQGGVEDIHANAPLVGGPPPLPETRDIEIDGLHLHLRRSAHELHDLQPTRSRDPIWPAIELQEADELRAWLIDGGITEVRLVGVTDGRSQRRTCPHVLGRRPQGDLHLWRVASANAGMTGKQLRLALTGLGVEVPGASELALEDCRRRVSALVDRLRDYVLVDLAARRARKLIDVDDHFEPPDVTVESAESPTPALAALEAWIEDDAAPVALLLGEFGAGKSSLLTVWAEGRWRSGAARLPVLVPLLEAAVDEAPTQLLLRALGRDDDEVERARLGLLVRHRRLVPCYDGIDEVATRIDEPTLRTRLRALADSTGLPGHVIIAARDHTFTSDGELARALPGARRLTMAPLSEGQVVRLIGAIRGADADAVLRRLAGTYDLTDLVRRPLLLGMVLRSLDELDPGARVGTADVYNAYIAHWLRGSHVGDTEGFNDDAKMVFAEELADQLWRSGEPTCSFRQLRSHVLDVLRERLVADDALDSISAFYEIQTGAFFVREGDAFRFAHRSFLEFFLARGLVRNMGGEPGRRFATQPFTREILLFVDQLLRREYGDPLASPPIQGVRAWLVSGAERRSEGGIDPRINALRMLLHLPTLARHAGNDEGHDTQQWVPEGARLGGIALPGEDLRHARLAGVDLSRAILCGADLRWAHLAGAQLQGGDLRATRLEGVDLANVDTSEADLEYAEDDAQAAALLARAGGSIVAAFPRALGYGLPSPDGRFRVFAPGSWMHVSLEPSGTRIASCLFPAEFVAWSPDGSQIAALSERGVLIVWAFRDDRQVRRIELDDPVCFGDLRDLREREGHHYFEYFGSSGEPAFLAFTGVTWADRERLRFSTVASTFMLSLVSAQVSEIECPVDHEEDNTGDVISGPDKASESYTWVTIDAFSGESVSGQWRGERDGFYCLHFRDPIASSIRPRAADEPESNRGPLGAERVPSSDGRFALDVDRTVRICTNSGVVLAEIEVDNPNVGDFDVSWSALSNRVYLLEHHLPSSSYSEANGPYGLRVLEWTEGSDAFTEFYTCGPTTNALTAIASIPGPHPRIMAGDTEGRVHIIGSSMDSIVEEARHVGRVFWVTRGPDCRRVVTADLIGTILFWEIDSLSVIAKRHTPALTDIRWAGDGSRLATTHRDRTVRLWSRDGALLATFAFDDDRWLIHTPDGLLVLDDPQAHVLVGCEMVDDELTMIRWLPLGGLRRILLRPDRVQAALQGDHVSDVRLNS
jgi:WD40 repeat protein